MSVAGRVGLVLLPLALAAGRAPAQMAPISADRPSVSYGTATIPRGRFQLEGGLEFRQSEGNRTVLTVPLAVLRVGAGPRTDVLVVAPSWVLDLGNGVSNGFEDLTIGARHRVADGSGRAAVLGLVTLPTGSGEFRGPTAVRVGMAAEADAGGGATLFGTGLVAFVDRADRVAADVELSGGVGGPLGGRLSGFVEAFAQARSRAAADNGGVLAGLGWLLSSDLQLDFYAGLDVASPATFIAGTGFSIRW